MLLMEDSFPIRILKPIALLVSVFVSLVIAFGVNAFLIPDHGRVAFFASVMSLFVVYSSFNMLSRPPVQAFVVAFVLAHIALCFISGLSDQSYYGAALIPAAILDYIAFVYVLYFIHKNTGH